MNPSASNLSRALHCPASEALPRVTTTTTASARGTAVHTFLARVGGSGRDDALFEVPEEYRAFCEALPLDEMPIGGNREISLAWDYETDKARVLGSDRDYSTVRDTEYFGTEDLAGVRGSRVVVYDWKTGQPFEPARDSAQLKFGALAMARLHGLDEAEVAFVYLRDDGTIYRDRAEFDAFDLAEFAEQLRALPARIGKSKLQVSLGETPDLSNGPWCKYCPAMASCPAKTALAKHMGADLVQIRERFGALSPVEAGEVYSRALQYRDMIESVVEGLKDLARVQPIELPDGSVLREVDWKLPTKVIPDVAEKVIREMYGDSIAALAVVAEKTCTLTGIDDALRKVSKAGSLAKMKRTVMDEIRKAGGLKEGHAPQVRIVKGERK